MNSSPSVSNFSSRHVVVTGGTGQLGSALVSALLDAGAEIHIPAYNDSEVEKFIHAANERVHLSTGIDLTDENQVIDFYSALPEPLWASVHIAGGFAMAPLAKTSKDDFSRQMNMNALSAFLCCREAANKMKNGGRIVNVAARPALEPRTGGGMVAYTASKAAVAAMTEAMGEELAPDKILVNAVAPSILDTAPNREAMPDADFSAWPKVEEVASTILYLASPENSVTRSAVVPVYGQS